MLYQRSTRKNDVERRGEMFFDYDEKTEIAIFRYVMGEEISRSDYKRIKKINCLFDSITQWREYIRKKYIKCDRKELAIYINHLQEKEMSIKGEIEIIITALVALFFTEPVGQLFRVFIEVLEPTNEIISNPFVAIVYYAIVIVLIVGGLVTLMYGIILAIHRAMDKNIKMEFYKAFTDILRLK